MRSLIIVMLVCGVASADDPKLAEKHFHIGAKAFKAQNFAAAAEQFEEALRNAPSMPDLIFNAALAHRKQYRVDRKIERAKRAAELFRAYLDVVKSGGNVSSAADGLEAMERALHDAGGAGKVAATTAAERTTIVVNPELATERKSGGIFELAETEEADATKIVVLVDGKPAPVYEKIDVEPGPHKIHIEAEGYVPLDTTERAVKGSNTTANIQLEPKPAKVTVKTEGGARIRVDGRPAGNGPVAELSLPAGRHVIGITRKGRDSIAREIVVTRGQVLTLDEPLEKTTRRKAVPWVAAGAGAIGVFSIISLAGAVYYDGEASDMLERFEKQGDRPESEIGEYNRLVERRDRLTTATWITGGAALLVGSAALVLYAFDTPGDAELRVTPAATPNGGAVFIGGTF